MLVCDRLPIIVSCVGNAPADVTLFTLTRALSAKVYLSSIYVALYTTHARMQTQSVRDVCMKLVPTVFEPKRVMLASALFRDFPPPPQQSLDYLRALCGAPTKVSNAAGRQAVHMVC